MKCRYCKITLAPSRIFVDGDFCCDDHRLRFELEALPVAGEAVQEELTSDGSLASPEEDTYEPELSEESAEISVEAAQEEFPSEIEAQVSDEEELSCEPAEAEPELAAASEITEDGFENTFFEEESSAPVGLTEETEEFGEEANEEPEPEPVYQAESYVEESSEPYTEETDSVEDVTEPVGYPKHGQLHQAAAIWQWASVHWKLSPRDVKAASLMVPVLLMIAITGSVPKVPIDELAPQNISQVQGQVQKIVVDNWKNLNQTISDRAAVAFADDFRSGLDAWQSRSNLTRSWSYDATGFVRPGPLAVFKPSVDLTDYRFEFLGEIDQKAIGWAFRAEDLNNYYAMKFVVVKPGPLPLVHIVRYAVINGKEGPHVEKPLPLMVRADMLYRVLVDARGSDFTIMAQGQVVDFWSDNRLRHGGIGFFCNRGEKARLRWVEVSHQYDALGRLCAYLAPYGIEGRNGSIN